MNKNVHAKEEMILLGRAVARELSKEELEKVAGGASGGNGGSWSGATFPDDNSPTDAF